MVQFLGLSNMLAGFPPMRAIPLHAWPNAAVCAVWCLAARSETVLLNPGSHSKYDRMNQDGQVHEDSAMPDVIEIVLKVFVNWKGPVGT